MSTVQVDTINESTTGSGVTVDGGLIKDNAVNTDTISEKTSATGVTIDGVLIKDSVAHSGIVQIVDNFDIGLTSASGSSTYVTGSSAQGKESGYLFWTPPHGASGTYKYQCQYHSGMIGDIVVKDITAI